MEYIEKLKNALLEYLPNIGSSLLIFLIGWWVIKILCKTVRKILERSKLDPTAHKLVVQVLDVLLKLMLVLIVLGNLGVDTTSLVTLVGAAGLAISLSLQDSLANFAGGIVILLSHPFRKGDFIETNGVMGTVQAINLWNTKLITADNKDVFIPNGELSAAKIINYSMEENRRLDIIVPIGYNDDVSLVKDILQQILADLPLAMDDPAPIIGVDNFGASSVDMVVKVWTKTATYGALKLELLERIKIAFDEKGITIPYQQLDVYVKGVDKQ